MSTNPDAALIMVCRQFAQADLGNWYRYVTSPDHLSDQQDGGPDWDAKTWIEATPATTPEGWRAKALAYSAWHRPAFDDPADDRDGQTSFLASLLRDIVQQERDQIVADLRDRYGPLPPTYSANGMWLGSGAVA
jgi:hypothetical protein